MNREPDRFDVMTAEDWAEYNAEHPPIPCLTPGLHGSACRCSEVTQRCEHNASSLLCSQCSSLR